MKPTLRAILPAVLTFWVTALPAEAREGQLRVTEENDMRLLGGNGDRYYTQGLRIEHSVDGVESDEQFFGRTTHADWCDLICARDRDPSTVTYAAGSAIGQNIYTPDNLAVITNQPTDRPYAAVLYASRFASASYPTKLARVSRQDRIEVLLGIVGPAAQGEFAQNFVHDLRGFDRANGWRNQLRNEPVGQVQVSRAWRWQPTGRHGIDATTRGAANAGNMLVSGELQGMVRAGINLEGFGVRSIGESPLAPPPTPGAAALAGAAPTDRHRARRLGVHLFARGTARLVAHNLFLDGNTFAANDIRIRRTPFVPEWAVGGEVNLWGWVVASYQRIVRGSEFSSTSGDAPRQRFGSVSLAFRVPLRSR